MDTWSSLSRLSSFYLIEEMMCHEARPVSITFLYAMERRFRSSTVGSSLSTTAETFSMNSTTPCTAGLARQASQCTRSLREPRVSLLLFLIGGLICSCEFWIAVSSPLLHQLGGNDWDCSCDVNCGAAPAEYRATRSG
nr:hypothetical protein CFP56_67474 [Quercus suber]